MGEDCRDDDRPYRLMFWEDISSEFVDCMARGITPVYLGSLAISKYVERNVMLVPFFFETAEDMRQLVQSLSSPEGVIEHGTRVYMRRQSNHILSSLYWRQHVHTRALLQASAAFQQRHILIGTSDQAMHIA